MINSEHQETEAHTNIEISPNETFQPSEIAPVTHKQRPRNNQKARRADHSTSQGSEGVTADSPSPSRTPDSIKSVGKDKSNNPLNSYVTSTNNSINIEHHTGNRFKTRRETNLDDRKQIIH